MNRICNWLTVIGSAAAGVAGAVLAVLVAGLVMAGGIAVSPATAATSPRPPAASVRFDVRFYRPVLRSVPRDPPLTTLLEFDVRAFVSAYPRQWHANVSMHWWRSAKALHRPKGAWVVIHPSKGWKEVDLCSVGTSCRLPALSWTCEQGAFYARIHIWGISSSGVPDNFVEFFPWKGFVKGHPTKGDVYKPPSLKLAWHTKCQGSDALQG